MMPILMLWLLILFSIKHVVCDFILLPPTACVEEQLQKWGICIPGLLHCSLHIVATMIILVSFFGFHTVFVALCIGEGCLHAAIDRYVISIRSPSHNEIEDMVRLEAWWLAGFDQWLHYITYITLVVLLFFTPILSLDK